MNTVKVTVSVGTTHHGDEGQRIFIAKYLRDAELTECDIKDIPRIPVLRLCNEAIKYINAHIKEKEK